MGLFIAVRRVDVSNLIITGCHVCFSQETLVLVCLEACVFVSMARSPPLSFPVFVHPAQSSFFFSLSASLLTLVETARWVLQVTQRGTRSRTDAMPLSVLPVPEGARGLRADPPTDFGPHSLRRGSEAGQQTESHTRVFAERSDVPVF